MFRDIYNLPVEIPANVGGGPSLDPEQWGILADCDRSLNAWKRLNRCLGVLEAIDRDEVRPQFEIFPAICTHSPNLDAIRELGLPLFHPQPGHHFVVGTLSNLNLRAFAYVCSSNRYSHRSRLANYFYTRQCAKAASRAIAEELCATSSGKDLWDRLDGTASVNSRVDPKSVASSLSPKVTDDAKRFANLEKLLEAFALGLNDVHLRNLLQTRYDIDLPIGDIAALRSHLAAGKILDDFKDFWAEDVLLRLSSVLNVGVMDIANKFSGISYEDKTLDRAIQNALQPGSCSTAIRKHIEKLLLASSSPPEITVNDLGDIVRNRYGVTRAGRPIPPGNASDVKRQQVLLAADEAMKAVAYALGAEGFSLVAVAGDQFVLEVDENRAAEPGFTDQLEVLVAQSQVPILGSSLAAPCKWAVSDQWPMPTDD